MEVVYSTAQPDFHQTNTMVVLNQSAQHFVRFLYSKMVTLVLQTALLDSGQILIPELVIDVSQTANNAYLNQYVSIVLKVSV